MPIVTKTPKVGTKLRYIGASDNRGAFDTTEGRIYVVAGFDEDEDPYFYDDEGDKNYAASACGNGNFEIVE